MRSLSPNQGIPKPAIIAHRGASYDAPESTKPAYLLARELGVDYLELDLQQTRDNVLVVFHDDDLRAKTDIDDKFPNRKTCPISHFTWDELQQLDAGSWFAKKYPNRSHFLFQNGSPTLRLLRLEDVIKIAEGGTHHLGLYIELKYPAKLLANGDNDCQRTGLPTTKNLEEELVRILKESNWIDPSEGNVPSGFERVIFQSFQPESLERLRTLAPHVPRVLLVDEVMVRNQGWEALIQTARTVAIGIGPWGATWAADPNWSEDAHQPYRAIDPKLGLIKKFQAAGLIVHAWTINEEWEMWEALDSHLDGFFTDRPFKALEVLGRANHSTLAEAIEKIAF